MVISEKYRQQVSMLARILPLVAEQKCFFQEFALCIDATRRARAAL